MAMCVHLNTSQHHTHSSGELHTEEQKKKEKKKHTKQYKERRKQKVRGSTEEHSHAAQLEHAPAQPWGFAYLVLSAKGHSAKVQWW